jgi:hypothetical protein
MLLNNISEVNYIYYRGYHSDKNLEKELILINNLLL